MTHLTLVNIGRRFESEGETAFEALKNLKVNNVRGKSVLIFKKGDITKERVIPAYMNRFLFSVKGIAQEAAFKNLASTFDL